MVRRRAAWPPADQQSDGDNHCGQDQQPLQGADHKADQGEQDDGCEQHEDESHPTSVAAERTPAANRRARLRTP